MTSQAMKVWTAFTTAFFALVAMLGFTTPAKAAARAAAVPAPADLTGLPGRTAGIPAVRTSPESASNPASNPASKSASGSAPAASRTADPAPVMPLAWWALPKARSLPPTIKQRIRAEAHGSTPGARRLPLDPEATSDEAAMEAAVGEAVLQPA